MTTSTASAAVAETLAFLRQFTRTAKMTGSIAPSGAALSRALTRHVQPGTPHQPRAVLEVGPGTGAVTRHLAQRLGSNDTLELVEANRPFVDHLAAALRHDARLAAIAPRTRLHHGLIQDQQLGHYDHIVCGLPFANFPPSQTEAVVRQLLASLRPGGGFRSSATSEAGPWSISIPDRLSPGEHCARP